MPSFAYSIRTASGQTKAGVLDAASTSAASAALREGGNLLLGLEPTDKSASPRQNTSRYSQVPFVRPRIATLEVVLRQLSVMLGSGLTLLEALRTAANQSSYLMRGTLIDIAERVQEGRSLSQALSQDLMCFGQQSEIARQRVGRRLHVMGYRA